MGLSLVVSSLFCFVTLQMLMQMQGCNGCFEKERLGLLEITAYFVAQPHGFARSELTSWVDDRTSNCCAWNRVKCANISTGHVTELSLSHFNDNDRPTWTLNVSLFRPFEYLVSLDLSSNSFQGWIDIEGFLTLKKLETLDLSFNPLNNSILPSLSEITSLRTLKLAFNSFNSSLSTQGFSRLKKLETLDLSANNLNRSIISSLTGLTSLRTLKLAGNWMGGSFSSQDLVTFSRLEQLDLSYDGLSGSLDSQDIQNLRLLKVLNLSNNELNGSIQGLCEMKALVELDLSSNVFSGQLPECLSFLSSLQVLDFSDNLFTGKFPSFISNLSSSLTFLSLSGNYMQGSFSLSTLANHSKLQFLYISSQSPEAQIETEATQWFATFQLKALILRSCNLNKDKGSVLPSFLLYQYDLHYIDLSGNKLVGALPSWLIQNNSRLQCFSLSSNSFLGNLQLSSIRQGLIYMDISNNHISGFLPKDIGIYLPNIEFLNLSMNSFEGNIPTLICEMKFLSVLDLSHNHFSGELPKQLATDCTKLVCLKLSNNNLQGTIPKFSDGENLVLFLNNNNFSGTLDEVLASNTSLELLDMSNNSISGAIPSSIGKLSFIRILLMGENQLEGEIPFEISNITELIMLDLSQNRLVGHVPYFNLSSLRFLYLQKNALSGFIPFTLSKSSQLLTLDLRDNKFSGNIPCWMDQLLELRVLLLGGNNFHGQIPIQLCRLKNVTIMDLSRNMINGSIPSCFKYLSFGEVENDDLADFQVKNLSLANTFAGMSDLDYRLSYFLISFRSSFLDDELRGAVEFRTKNHYYTYRGRILDSMSGLDLSCNKLTGFIPPQIGNLRQIHALNLSHNYLSGSIPNTFSNLSQIESLDLSYNNLSGEIPSQLTQLNFLAIFNVSYNNLSGTPPSTGQFGGFDEENYRGNPGLCGPLLKRRCERVATPPLSQFNDAGEKEALVDMVAFYWSFTACYITILIGFLLVLYINPQWRMAWSHFIDKVILRCFPNFPLY